jgi:membrane protease YdiL (CAAX protease family)
VSEAILNEQSPDKATEPVPPIAARWGFWGTCAWGIGAFIVFYATQLVVLIGLLIWWGIDPTGSPAEIRALGSNAVVVSATTIICVPAVVLFLALAIRFARVRFVDYLALKPVGARTILLVLACTLAYGAVLEVLTMFAGRPLLVPFVSDLYRTSRESGTLALVLIAVVVAAPITEEFLFRGFLLRGWAASWLRPIGAVVLTSAIWAIIHVQYDWIVVSEIFGLGLLLGYFRLRTGSLVPTVLAHGIYGLAAMIQVAILSA